MVIREPPPLCAGPWRAYPDSSRSPGRKLRSLPPAVTGRQSTQPLNHAAQDADGLRWSPRAPLWSFPGSGRTGRREGSRKNGRKRS